MTPCPIDMFLISQEFVSSLGLILDIVGAILIFVFGLPIEIKRKAGLFWLGEENQPSFDEIKAYTFWPKTGLVLLVLGFSFQLVANWLPPFMNYTP